MSNVSNMFAALPQAAARTEQQDPKTLLFIGFGANGRLKSLPDQAFVQVGFTSAEIEMGKTPSGEPAHCVICSGTIADPVTRAQFRATMSQLIALNQERSRGTKQITAEEMATYFARSVAHFGLAVEQYRPLESSEEVRRQIEARSGGRTRTGGPVQADSFDFKSVIPA